jgi:uncharacterized protein YpmS
MAKRLFKRALILLGLVVVGVAVFLGVSAYLYKADPLFYVTRMTPAELDANAQIAEQKFIEARNWAEHTRAIASAKSKGVTTNAIGGTTVTFSADELNAFFQKWQGLIDWESKYGKYLSQPGVALMDGHVVLFGNVKDMGTVASLHFKPGLDARGQLVLTLDRVMAGRLPMPAAVWQSQKDRIANALSEKLPEWQRQARMDKAGSTNGAGVQAAMTRLLLNVLRGEASDPVVFLPIDDRGAIPARVTAVDVKDGRVAMSVDPMDADERQVFLAKIKEPVRLQAALGQ